MDFPEKQVNNDISIYRLFGHLKIVINVSQYKNIFNPDIYNILPLMLFIISTYYCLPLASFEVRV